MKVAKDNSKLIIIGGVSAMAIGLVGTVFFMTADFGKTPAEKPTEPTAVSSEVKEKKKAKDKPEEIVRVMTPYTQMITPVGYGDKEFPAEKAATLKASLLDLAEGGEVSTMIAQMEKELATFRFSEGVNLEIAGIYADATMVNGLVGKTDAEMREILPGAFKTPEMLALMPLYLPELARRDIIHDNLSLTPLTEGPFKIRDIKFIKTAEDADKDESYQDNGIAISMFNVVEGIHQIQVIELIREEEPDVPIRAYISELANGELALYGYYIPDGVTHYYQNIEFFKQLDTDYLEPNEKYQHEQIQKEIDEGKIPDEVIEEFLNPTK